MKYKYLFTPFQLGDMTLENRITMAPLYLGYASIDGSVSNLILEYYARMAASGVSLIVVENAIVDQIGLGSPFSLRIDKDRHIQGMGLLADTIKEKGVKPFLQLNHAGRWSFLDKKIAPSPVKAFGDLPKAMDSDDIKRTIRSYVSSALRAKKAGFDGVELHGATGFLLNQFLSPFTNKRKDAYGGPLENRMRFPLEVFDALRDALDDFPIGYRFQADEKYPGGLTIDDTVNFAKALEDHGVTYLSITCGINESLKKREYLETEKKAAYSSPLSGAIKRAVGHTPVILAGRMSSPDVAEKMIKEESADLIGIARVLLADPLWPQKARGTLKEPIVKCGSECHFCLKKVMRLEPAFCPRNNLPTWRHLKKLPLNPKYKRNLLMGYFRQRLFHNGWPMPKMPVQRVITSISINSSPEKIWEVLTDFRFYPEWNPIMTISGDLGGKMEVGLMVKERRMEFIPKILTVRDPFELSWRGGRLGWVGVHTFRIMPRLRYSLFYQEENLYGFFVRLLGKKMLPNIYKVFNEMNWALKKRVES